MTNKLIQVYTKPMKAEKNSETDHRESNYHKLSSFFTLAKFLQQSRLTEDSILFTSKVIPHIKYKKQLHFLFPPRLQHLTTNMTRQLESKEQYTGRTDSILVGTLYSLTTLLLRNIQP